MNSPKQTSPLDKAFNDALLALDDLHPSDESYGSIVDNVVKIHRMKTEEKPSPVSRDTLALIGANLVGIVLILTHEHTHVIASKAMSFAIKPK